MLLTAPPCAVQEKENDEWKDLQELMETPEKNRLSINLDNIRDFSAEMYDDCHNRPSRVIPAYEKAMNDLVRAELHTLIPRSRAHTQSSDTRLAVAHSRCAGVRYRSATWTRPTACRTD